MPDRNKLLREGVAQESTEAVCRMSYHEASLDCLTNNDVDVHDEDVVRLLADTTAQTQEMEGGLLEARTESVELEDGHDQSLNH